MRVLKEVNKKVGDINPLFDKIEKAIEKLSAISEDLGTILESASAIGGTVEQTVNNQVQAAQQVLKGIYGENGQSAGNLYALKNFILTVPVSDLIAGNIRQVVPSQSELVTPQQPLSAGRSFDGQVYGQNSDVSYEDMI